MIIEQQQIQKRLGIAIPILHEFCQQHKITELSVFDDNYQRKFR